jgi:hypothetical protein
MPPKGKASPQQRAWLAKRWPKQTVEERFWSHVDKSGDCWLWTGYRNPQGYGIFNIRKGKWEYAHRYAWKLTYQSPLSSLHVLHHCDNPPCVRGIHLWIGTHQDNMADMMRKGRQKKGVKHATHRMDGMRSLRKADAV